MEIIGAAALTPAMEGPLAAAQVPAPSKEGKDTPKIALGMGDGGGSGFGGAGGGAGRGGAGTAAADTPPPDPIAGPRRIKQLGVGKAFGRGGGISLSAPG